MAEGLALLLDPILLFYVVVGVTVCTFVVVVPGLGGTFAIAILLPFVVRMEPLSGIVLIMAISAVNGTGNTITSVLFGIPGSASGVVSTFDGYPMTQRGEGVRAVTAGLMSSLVGGLIGAAVLAVSLPVLRQIVLAFRPPEFLLLICLALVVMASVGDGDRLPSLLAAGLGLLLSFVGMEPSTATQRWTFGAMYLWDGLHVVPLILGLYAVAEMIDLLRSGGAITNDTPQHGPWRQIRSGVADTLRYRRAVVQSSIAGVWVGMAPGLGDAAAQFVGYGQVARSSPRGAKFGTGEVEGVIAADAATNAKEGGALIPTLAFGIPGSSAYVLILAAFLALGVQPGPAMLTDSAHIVWLIIGVLVLANALAVGLCRVITPALAKVTHLDASYVVPPILLASVVGAYSVNRSYLDVVVLAVFAVVGVAFKATGYSRSMFLIGFVLGPMVERNLLLTGRIFGWSFLTRPLALLLFSALVVVILLPLVRRRYRRSRHATEADEPTG